MDFQLISSFNPMFKFDGYWALSDLIGVPNLHARVGEYLRYTVGRLILRLSKCKAGLILSTLRKLLGEQRTEPGPFWQLHSYAKVVVWVYILAGTFYFAYVALFLPFLVRGVVLSYPALVRQAWREGAAALAGGDTIGVGNALMQIVFPTAMIVGLTIMLLRLSKMLKRTGKTI